MFLFEEKTTLKHWLILKHVLFRVTIRCWISVRMYFLKSTVMLCFFPEISKPILCKNVLRTLLDLYHSNNSVASKYLQSKSNWKLNDILFRTHQTKKDDYISADRMMKSVLTQHEWDHHWVSCYTLRKTYFSFCIEDNNHEGHIVVITNF